MKYFKNAKHIKKHQQCYLIWLWNGKKFIHVLKKKKKTLNNLNMFLFSSDKKHNMSLVLDFVSLFDL